MNLRILPPENATIKDCYRHLNHMVRVRTKATRLSRQLSGHMVATGPVGDLVMLKFLLPRYGYRLI